MNKQLMKIKNIQDHFIEAAIAKGMPEMGNPYEEVIINKEGKEYKIILIENEKGLSIYSDGSFDYEGEIEGKLMRPHDKRWIAKLVRNGMALEFARSDVFKYMSFNLESKAID